MRSRLPILVSFVVATLCTGCRQPSVVEAPPDAGVEEELFWPDAGDPLERLSRKWDEKACVIYACVRRLQTTEQVCARMKQERVAPWNTLRVALTAVAAERARYDAEAAQRCADFIDSLDTTLPCFGPDTPPILRLLRPAFEAACGQVVEGLVAPGSACDADVECAVDGGACLFNRTNDCSGVCVQYLQPGESCEERPRDCAPRSYCDGAVCQAPPLSPDGAACYDDGSSCESGKCFDYRCKQTSGYNGECVEQDDCDPWYYCRPLPPSTGRLGVCQVPAQTGQQCGYIVHCEGNQSCPGHFWGPMVVHSTGLCQVAPHGVGAPCVPIPQDGGYTEGDTGCFGDLTCDPTTSLCAVAPSTASPCAEPGRRCGLDSWCDDDGTCRAKKLPGQPADAGIECLDQFDSYRKQCYSMDELRRCDIW
jgi:hypothetical protein